jgi:hypothetical protein
MPRHGRLGAPRLASQTRPCARGSASLDRRAAPNHPAQTQLGKALRYLHRQWQSLVLFSDDGNIEATNNRRERELRRLILGRKNWLFTWLDVGGEKTAGIPSIVASRIAHDVNPRAYLHVVQTHRERLATIELA